jgi:hypothetical protein
MLNVENQFEEVLTPKEMGEWSFISREHLMRAKRYFYSMSALVDIRLSDEMFDESVKMSSGLCPMLSEAILSYISIRDFLGEELKLRMNRMDRAIAASRCRRTIIHKIWNESNREAYTTLEGVKILGKRVTFDQLERSADLRAAVGYNLGANIVNPYFL